MTVNQDRDAMDETRPPEETVAGYVCKGKCRTCGKWAERWYPGPPSGRPIRHKRCEAMESHG